MSRKIEIIISPTGESRVELAGSECREASRFLEAALVRFLGIDSKLLPENDLRCVAIRAII